MRRCHYCPSTELRAQRLHPVDLLLLPIGVVRRRCAFCGEAQRHWLVPRFVRWVFALLLLGTLYLALPGPVDWIHARGGMTRLTHERLNLLIFSPINSILDPEKASTCRMTDAYWRYRAWWVPPNTDDDLRTTSHRAGPLLDITDLD